MRNFDSWLPVTEEGRIQAFRKGRIWGLGNPIAFIIPAFGMKIGSLLLNLMESDLDTAYNLLLFGRLFNFFAFYCVITAAVRRTPIFRRTMIAIALLPMTIYLCSSLSYDSLVISVSMLIFSEVFALIMNDDMMVDTKRILILFVCAIVLAAVKIVYFPFFALCFFIPIKRFRCKKQYCISVTVVASGALIGYIIPAIVYNISYNSITLVEESILVAQKQFFS